jgi:hypothetical protein
MMDNNQVERQINNVVGVVIFMNPISVKEKLGNSSEGKEEISARESMEGKEDDWMETSSTWHFLQPSSLSGTADILPVFPVLTYPSNATPAPSADLPQVDPFLHHHRVGNNPRILLRKRSLRAWLEFFLQTSPVLDIPLTMSTSLAKENFSDFSRRSVGNFIAQNWILILLTTSDSIFILGSILKSKIPKHLIKGGDQGHDGGDQFLLDQSCHQVVGDVT